MEIMLKSRGSGKTTALIKRAHETREQIVCLNQEECHRVNHQANLMGLTIRKPMSFSELLDEKTFMGMPRLSLASGIIIDNADAFIEYVVASVTRGRIDVNAITMTTPQQIKETELYGTE